eukprot:4565673-Karenia_brevis.AAC.1
MPSNTAEKNFEPMGNAGSIARMKKKNLTSLGEGNKEKRNQLRIPVNSMKEKNQITGFIWLN